MAPRQQPRHIIVLERLLKNHAEAEQITKDLRSPLALGDHQESEKRARLHQLERHVRAGKKELLGIIEELQTELTQVKADARAEAAVAHDRHLKGYD